MEENKVQQDQGSFIHQILRVLKRHIGLMLAIIIIATGCGVGYSYVRDPEYTVNITVEFTVKGKGIEIIGENMQFIDTIVDFVDEGVVVDRANAYYIKWVDEYKVNGEKVEDFYNRFKDLELNEGVNVIYNEYDRVNTLKADRFIYASKITTQTKKNKNGTHWIFQIGYTDSDSQDALEKAYLLGLAYEHELEGGYENSNGEEQKYIKNRNLNIRNLGFASRSLDMSKINIIIVAFAIGLILALALVYLKTLLDNTVKDKTELERITGVEIIGCIDLVEEGKNGK